ncbi:hypothetical protein [Streptosporangium sandarakinum]
MARMPMYTHGVPSVRVEKRVQVRHAGHPIKLGRERGHPLKEEVGEGRRLQEAHPAGRGGIAQDREPVPCRRAE